MIIHWIIELLDVIFLKSYSCESYFERFSLNILSMTNHRNEIARKIFASVWATWIQYAPRWISAIAIITFSVSQKCAPMIKNILLPNEWIEVSNWIAGIFIISCQNYARQNSCVGKSKRMTLDNTSISFLADIDLYFRPSIVTTLWNSK